jgi:hypothetical protein
MALEKVISGGQTGVDRAALDAARAAGLEVGGWCPRGRLAEDGAIDEGYPLHETPSEGYLERTEWNVRDADATLVLNVGELEGGTASTVTYARDLGRPCRLVDLDDPDPQAVVAWIAGHSIQVLNVGGPRSSKEPDIYQRAYDFLAEIFEVVGRRDGMAGPLHP